MIGVGLLAASIEFALSQVARAAFWDGFELPPGVYPTYLSRLSWLWQCLGIMLPGLIVGLSLPRRAALISSLSYVAGNVADFCYHDGERLVPHQFLPGLKYWPWLLRELLIVAIVGATVGLVAAWARRRITIVWSGRKMHEST
jgi:hypothetical protein